MSQFGVGSSEAMAIRENHSDARETGLGYTRIQGELKKLGINLSRSTIKGVGMSPDLSRGEGRWDEFLKMHAESL